MARIRTIKPEFPQSESMGRVSRDARLLFVMLWTLCDDSGRTRAASRMLASLLFPYDDDAKDLIDGWLAELEREQCIVCYQVEGQSYLQVCKWLNHQKIDRPSESKIPPFDESSRDLANPRETSSLDQGSRIKDQGEEKDRKEKPTAPSKKRSGASSAVELDTWLSSLADEKPVKADDKIFDYAESIKLPFDFIELAWKRFCQDMRGRKIRKKDWRAHFRNAVQGNWHRLWCADGDGWKLTTAGEQARRSFA
ncbi:MAG: hypothetical protein KGL35_00935 [Bradyrhizobium sp.]|nr:hypothetical protein [Bradyrhizobium sp.]